MENDKVLQIIEKVRNTGKVKIGTNEVTKAIERGVAKLVVAAQDTSPKEVIMHLKPLCDEKKIPYAEVDTRQNLGRSAGIDVSTAAIAVLKEGDAKKDIEALGAPAKPAPKKEEPKKEKPAEKPKEEPKEEAKPEEKPAENKE